MLIIHLTPDLCHPGRGRYEELEGGRAEGLSGTERLRYPIKTLKGIYICITVLICVGASRACACLDTCGDLRTIYRSSSYDLGPGD